MDIDEFLDRETRNIHTKPKTENKFRETEQSLQEVEAEQPVQETEQPIQETAQEIEDISKKPGKSAISRAEIIYHKIWSKLVNNAAWNREIYDNLLKVGTQIKNAMSVDYSEAIKKKNLIESLIQKARGHLAQRDYQLALDQYSELIDIHQEIPPFLINEKRILHKEILNLYVELKDKMDSDLMNTFEASTTKIKQMIGNARILIKKADFESAKSIYLDIVDTFTNLPPTFLSQKVDLGSKILELYKEVGISLEIKRLESQLPMEIKQSMKLQQSIEKQPLFKNQERQLLSSFEQPPKPITSQKPLPPIEKQPLFKNQQRPLLSSNPFERPLKPKLFAVSKDPSHKRELESLRNLSKKEVKPKVPEEDAKDHHINDPIKRLSKITKRSGSGNLQSLLINRRLNRARLKMRMGHYKEAKKDFESVLHLDPDNKDAKSMLKVAIQK